MSDDGYSELLRTQIKVEALLMEYDTLRSEMVFRMNSRFAVIGYLGAMIAFVAFQTGSVAWPEAIWPLSLLTLPKQFAWPLALVVLSLLFLFVVWRRFGTLIKRLSKRVTQIEHQVNNLIGEDILVWETLQHKTGIFHRL
jgi:hypothetical protein